jgi:hypothetical protein
MIREALPAIAPTPRQMLRAGHGFAASEELLVGPAPGGVIPWRRFPLNWMQPLTVVFESGRVEPAAHNRSVHYDACPTFGNLKTLLV